MSRKETYLGDSVYASFDGYVIWLRTGDGNNQRIALEPAVFDALLAFRRSLYGPAASEEAADDRG